MEQSMLGDRYRVEARIGEGGMAEVYRGLDTVLNRTVAIKVLLPQFARDAGFVSRFRREAQAAARLNHPNIVGVFDTGADGDTQYIVMEFVEGRTLAQVLGSGKRPSPMQSVELAQRIAQALAVAHAQGIVHRDIKPANVMVTREGKVKVMDFGIARMQTLETAPQTSSVLGTPTYLSPEQAQGQPVDARSDIYSLGVLLYEMLAGRPPFTGDSPVAIAYKQVNETPVPPSTLNPDVPPRLDAVVMKALAKNPANRYQDAEAMAADLERVKQGQEVEATPLMAAAGGDATQVIARPQATQVMPPSEPESGSRKIWLGVLIGALIVAAVIGGGYLLAQTLLSDDTPVTVAVPNLRNMTLDEATDALEAANLVVGLVTPEPTNEEEPGTVLRQSPNANTPILTGSAVDLWVAEEVALVRVPDLTGLTIEEAASRLDGSGLEIGTKTDVTSDEYEPGQIAAQDPPSGTRVDPSDPDQIFVDVEVVSGPSAVVVGDYTCRPYGAASAELRQQNLVASFGGTAPKLPQCPNKNFVALQDPPPGTEVAPGSVVTLYTGEDTTPTPTASPT